MDRPLSWMTVHGVLIGVYLFLLIKDSRYRNTTPVRYTHSKWSIVTGNGIGCCKCCSFHGLHLVSLTRKVTDLSRRILKNAFYRQKYLQLFTLQPTWCNFETPSQNSHFWSSNWSFVCFVRLSSRFRRLYQWHRIILTRSRCIVGMINRKVFNEWTLLWH